MSDIDQQLDRLTELCADRMRKKIRECLRNAGRPMTTREIALALEVDPVGVKKAVCHMYGVRRELTVEPGFAGKPRYYPIDQGHCEWCGAFDGYLIAGECPQCRTRTRTYDPIQVIQDAERARAEEEQEVPHVEHHT